MQARLKVAMACKYSQTCLGRAMLKDGGARESHGVVLQYGRVWHSDVEILEPLEAGETTK